MQKTESLLAQIRKTLPAKVKFKDESKFMKFLAFCMFFNKDFMTGYITTLGYTIFFPTRRWTEARDPWDITAHEYIHMEQFRKNALQGVLYLFPQVLAVLSLLSLLAIWLSSWWLMSLLFLLTLAPLPAPWRMKYEMEGYSADMAIEYWRHGSQMIDPGYVFSNAGYYWMWPFKKDVAKRIAAAKMSIANGDILRDARYKLIHDWVLDNWAKL